MTQNKTTELKTPTVLAFERKIDISDAVFMQKDSENNTLKPVIVKEKSIKSTISNRLKQNASDEALKANLQTVDVATLDHDCDTLVVKFTCKILQFLGEPCVCNNKEYKEKIESIVHDYLNEHSIKELSTRYATNIANGRWLWRNRVGAETIKITIQHKDKNIVINNSKEYSLNDFSTRDESIKFVADIIEQGFIHDDYVIFNITAELKLGHGQEVYPSQELILDQKEKKTKSKILYNINGVAGMHSQKISNAIRTIDTWYQNNATFPISVETYGSVVNLGIAFRKNGNKNDFYTLFDNWILKDIKPEVEQQHFVIANLIRGGIFGKSGKE